MTTAPATSTDKNALLKSVGLQVLGRIPWFRRKAHGTDYKSEKPKVVIHSSVLAALASLNAHTLPVLTSVTIIALNLGGLYLGKTIPGLIDR